jgi:hypothetical protein
VRSPLFVISVLLAVFVFWTHRANIQRLRAGQEHRFGNNKGERAKRPNPIVPIALVVAAAIFIAARFG